MRVALAGHRLVDEVPDADRELVLLFALLHDTRRRNDGRDPEHGPRAARLAREINDATLGLSHARLDVLARAIHDHTHAARSDDPTIAVCFDADRLNLWRVGITPDPSLLSTAPARRAETIEWSSGLGAARLGWDDVVEAFAAPTPSVAPEARPKA